MPPRTPIAESPDTMTGHGAHGIAEGLCRALKEGNADEAPAWIEALIRIMFPETPDRITREVSQYAAPTAEALCWNRRKRRSLERSKGVILHLCCGSCRGEFQASASRHGMIVLDVDCKEDLNNPHTASYLLRVAGLGKLRGVMSSPRDWGVTRDLAITDTQITVPAVKAREKGDVTEGGIHPDVAGKSLVLRPSAADSQVWSLRALASDGNTTGPALAWVAVYVDDVFIMGLASCDCCGRQV